MTTQRTSLARYRNAYLDYLEGDRAAPPPVGTLNAVDQKRARAWVRSLDACRDVDPYAARPSLSELLARINETR